MKHRFIKTILLNVGLFFTILTNAQTHLGSWIVATDYSYYDPNVTCTSEFYELQFTTTGINTVLLGNASGITGFNNRLDIATGSGYYSTDNSPACYVLVNNDRISYYNSNNLLSHNTFWDNMNHTTMVIPKPGSSTKYCAIYAASGIAKGSQGDMWISVISNPGGQLGVDESHSFAFYKPDHTDWCMTSELAGDRHIYFTTNPEGLCRVSVNEVLADNETLETLVAPDTYGLAGHFGAHEIELKQHANTVDIAWTTLESSGDLYRVIYNFATNSSQVQVHHLNQGVIAGIEYDQYENDIIYVSCEAGIVKYNFDTETSTTLASSGNYKHTCLQTAPDGYIYGVRDQGGYLGRIDQQTATFTPEAYHFNYTGYGSDPDGYLTNKRIVDNQVYFLLPKHDVLSSLAEPVAVSCPGMSDGQVTIYAGGGTPEYTLSCFLGTTEITGFYYNNADYTFYHDALSEGFYTYTLYDARGMQAKGSFEIEEDDSYYDFKDTKFEVSASRSLPDAAMPLNTYSFEAGILIRSGATLTITGSVYEFGKWAKVIVEPGATLELVGTTLTNHEECHLIWQGVEVQGNSNLPQQPELINGVWVYHQGRLVMQNATIENAVEAVGLLQRNDNNEVLWDKSGGIVVANNSHFINNVNSIHFIPYKNRNYNAILEIGNASYFSNCTFDLNEDFLGDDYTFYKHVDLDKVKGIEFRNCGFNLTATNGVSPYNQGIAAYESEFSVLPNCHNAVDPCPEEYILHSTFSGFYRAVASYNSDIDLKKFFTIRQAIFTNNSVGVYAVSTKGAIVINSTFGIGENPVSKANYQVSESFGIDMHSSNGFILEDNEFEKFSGAEDGHYTGIRVFACPSVSDDIYRNKYTGLSVGNLAEENNRYDEDDDKTGVTYECNQNFQNEYDFHVATNSRIKGNMGYPDMPSGNILTDPSICESQLQNDGTQDIRYYFYSGNPLEWMTEYSDYVYVYSVATPNACPTLHGTGGVPIKLNSVQKIAKETEYAEKLSDYNNVETLYNSLMDGGSTEAELSDIESATPDEMWLLRNKLLGDSPHLSQEVLIAISDRTDVFPDAILLEILSANPEELRKEELISYLEDKENPLPEYMIDILMQVANGSTYKSVLQNQMALYHHGYVNAAQDIIRSLQHDSITDYVQLRYWLDNIGGYEMDKQIISTYMEEGDYTAAQSLLNTMPSIYELDGDQLLAYNDYHSLVMLQIQMAQQQRNIHQLTSSELATITNLADNGMESAKYSARSILEYAYDAHYFDRPSLPENIGLKTVKPIDQGAWAKAMGLQLSVDPNPASTWAEFTWQLPPAETMGLITITDIAGKTVSTINISENRGKQVWDTREIKSGVYICTLSAGNATTSTKLVIR